MLGLFEIIKYQEILIKLQLSQSIKIHNVFHLNLFRKALIDSSSNQVNEPSFLVIINNKEE